MKPSAALSLGPLAGLVLAAFLLTLAACGGSDDGASESNSDSSVEEAAYFEALAAALQPVNAQLDGLDELRAEAFDDGPNPAAAFRIRWQAPDPAAAPGAAPPVDGWTRADDADVLTASVAGDDAAWSELVARYGRLVVSVPRRYGLGREACEDIFQEVFAILVRQLPEIGRAHV